MLFHSFFMISPKIGEGMNFFPLHSPLWLSMIAACGCLMTELWTFPWTIRGDSENIQFGSVGHVWTSCEAPKKISQNGLHGVFLLLICLILLEMTCRPKVRFVGFPGWNFHAFQNWTIMNTSASFYPSWLELGKESRNESSNHTCRKRSCTCTLQSGFWTHMVVYKSMAVNF